MQRCPKCNRNYQDDKQKFCTHDGGRLAPYEPPLGEAPTSFDLGATMRTDSNDLGETLLDKAAELNRTMAAPPPPPPSPQLNKTIAVPSASPANIPAAAPTPTPTPPPPPAQSQPQQQKTIVAPPPPPPQSSPSTGEIRPTGTMPASSPTSELPRPQATTGFATPTPPTPPAPQASQPAAWSPPPAQPARPQTPTAPSGHVDQYIVPATPAPPLPPGQITQPVGKKSRTPLIIGGVVALLLLVAAASVVGYIMLSRAKSEPQTQGGPGLSSNVSSDNVNANTSANTNTAANVNANTGAFEAPPNSSKFVNSRANLDGKLAEHYADFSFYYPRLWTPDPKSGVPGASNFVKVDRIIPPSFRQESFAVGWYDSRGTMESDRPSFPKLINQFSNNLSGSFPNYEKVSEGDAKINSYDGYEFRFKSVAEGTERGDVTIWGRVIFLPPEVEGSKNGLVLLMFTTSVAADLSGVEEVGKKGELAMIIDTFRLGSNP
jgi:hypothetical protein